MLSRKRKTKDPCEVCFLHRSRCLCDRIPRLDLRTRVTLVVHAKELKRTTNTGRLAVAALSHSSIRVRGEGREAMDLSDLMDPNHHSVLLYPSADARILDAEYVARQERPLHLIVPDGNWRQASKVHTRHAELSSVPRVMLAIRQEPRPLLRKETTPFGMATLEAIAHALRVIEGEAVGSVLLALYREKLERTLAGRPPPS